MFYLSLLLLLATQSAQPTVSQPADTTPAPVEIPHREVLEHMPADRLAPFLRVETKGLMFQSLEVQTTVNREGSVIAATALRTRNRRLNTHLQLPPEMYEQAEAMVGELHFKPFERGGTPVPATFNFYVSLLPPELKPDVHVPFPEVKDWQTLKITLRRTGCFGNCPIYTIEVHGDGAVLNTGIGSAVSTGIHRGTVPVESVFELVKLFEQADYFSLRDEYALPVTDLPTYITAIEFDGQRKQVSDYAGEQIGMPMSVVELEKAIDRLADFAR